MALKQPSQAADESGFVGHAKHYMDQKGRIVFPKNNILLNGSTYPRKAGFVPISQTQRNGHSPVYLFHPSSLRVGTIAPSLGLMRHPTLVPDAMGRLLISKPLRDIIGEMRDKLYIGAGPYCILTDASPDWEAKLSHLLLPDETVRELLGRTNAANGSGIREISDLVRSLVAQGAVNTEIDLRIGDVRVRGNLHLSREPAEQS